MSEVPEGLRYSEKHEWMKVEGDLIRIGITDFAQSEMGVLSYVELPGDMGLPDVGGTVEKGEDIAIIESVKNTEEIFTNVSGTIVEVNSGLADDPDIINNDPYGEGWLVIIKPDNMADVEKMLAAAEYKAKFG